MTYYAAVDQGGSKTEAIVFTGEGAILAFADDRDVRRPGESYAQKQGEWIRCAVQKALDKAGLPLAGLSGASCALNGADWPEDYDRLRQLVSRVLEIPLESAIVVNDCVGALRGGADAGNRAVLSLGSGMNAAVQAEDGREYIFGYFANAPDQGGGAIGTRAWQTMLDAYNGFCPPTRITDLALERYGQPDLVTLYKQFTSNRIVFRNYDFSPLVMKAAKEQDEVAREILLKAAHRLVLYIELGARKLQLENSRITLVLTGGVFKGDGDILFRFIEQEIQRKRLDFVCVAARLEPVAGSALLLLDRLPEPQRTEARDRFTASAPAFGLLRNALG